MLECFSIFPFSYVLDADHGCNISDSPSGLFWCESVSYILNA